MGLTLTTGPTSEPLTVAEVKEHLRISHADEDTYIGTILTAARQYCEEFTGRQLFTATWTLTCDGFPGTCVLPNWIRGDAFYLPRPRLASVTSIAYVDVDGATQTLATSVYAVDTSSEPGVVSLKYQQYWPNTRGIRNAVTITYVAGWSATSSIPPAIKHGILLAIGDMYEHREDTITGTFVVNRNASEALWMPYRVYEVF